MQKKYYAERDSKLEVSNETPSLGNHQTLWKKEGKIVGVKEDIGHQQNLAH